MLRDLRAYLCGISVNRLTSGNDQVIIQIADSRRDRLRGCPGICPSQYTVCNQNSLIRAHCQRFPKDCVCFRQTHGNNRNLRTVLILDS